MPFGQIFGRTAPSLVWQSQNHAPSPPKSKGELITWRCPSLDRDASATLPPFLVYSIGNGDGNRLAGQMFSFVNNDSDVGDGYVVTGDDMLPYGFVADCAHAGRRARRFNLTKSSSRAASHGAKHLFGHGALAGRRCHPVQTVPWPRLPFASAHYSAKYTMLKVDLLEQLPVTLKSVVLLDADTLSLPRSGARLAEQLALLRSQDSSRFMAVGLSGVREVDQGQLVLAKRCSAALLERT